MSDSLLSVSGVSVDFARPRRGLTRPPEFRALDDVSVRVGVGETVGLVGESGSGKSTLTRVILGLQRAVAGTVVVDGINVPIDGGRFPAHLRSVVQVVFQDPFASLNPAMTIEALIGEGVALHHGIRGDALRARVFELLDAVRLPRAFASRRPTELSGGQRQRVSMARALGPTPKLVLLDEPVSSLDATTQRQIVSLLGELQRELGVAYLFVGHDLGLINEICRNVVVLYQGRVMESGTAGQLWSAAANPYTQALLAAVPVPDPSVQALRRRQRLAFDATVGSAMLAERTLATPGFVGCAFAGRCPRVADVCRTTTPKLRAHTDQVEVACHNPGAVLTG
jgi:oligopeptide/dipeptide ABC transporter ATP-binding protein